MDCNYTNQRRSQLGCPQFTAGTSQNCGCNAGTPPLRPPVIQPRPAMEPSRIDMTGNMNRNASISPNLTPNAVLSGSTNVGISAPGTAPAMNFGKVSPVMNQSSFCPDTSVGGMENYPIGMSYVPWQQWKQTYALDRGFQRGTIFPELDLPFVMGRCR